MNRQDEKLTLLLAYRGDVTAARYHAERLVAETADEQLRAGLQTFILNNTSRKPGGFALRFALLPSSNQTRGSAEQEILIGGVPFTLNPASRASSGVGLAIGGTAWRRWQWNERWSGVGTASLDAKFYDSALNTETTAVARFDVIRGGQRGRFSFGPIAELSFSDSDIVRRRWGASCAEPISCVRVIWCRVRCGLTGRPMTKARFVTGTGCGLRSRTNIG
ncbi:hypothetical protein [Sulfitobacter pontiacus]|uniref:hypothetical protein n=1 Tax=Sulfitobacter pontiacus TaxID=60137 RepID=UPI0034632673